MEREASRGLPDFLGRFRTRYAFLVGLVFALCAVSVLSRFVLVIQVSGNQEIPSAVILSQLRQLGVRPGVYGPGLNRKQLAQELLVRQEGLSWAALNLHGTRLEVIVREEIKTPERVDESGHFDIVAQADGVITHIEPELGDALVKDGDGDHGAAQVQRAAQPLLPDPRQRPGVGPDLAVSYRRHPGGDGGEGVYRGGKKRLVAEFFRPAGKNFWKD